MTHKETIIKCLGKTTLGREGLIMLEMFKGDVKREARELIDEGKVLILKHWIYYSHCSNGTHIGLASEEYPTTEKEWDRYRRTGASETLTFKEFKEALEAGKYDKEVEAKGLKAVQTYFGENFNYEYAYMNYFKKHLSEWRVKAYKNIIAGMTPEENIEDLFIRYSGDELYSDYQAGKFSHKKDKEWLRLWMIRITQGKIALLKAK